MVDHTNVNHFHGNVNSHGGPLFQGTEFHSSGIINIGHVRLRSTHVRIARRVLEVIEFILSIMILGITGSASVGMKSDLGFAGIPGKLSYNIGVAAFSMIILLIMAIIEWIGPIWLYDNTTREPWPRIFMNILLTGLWIGTIPASFYTCGDLCSAAGPNTGDIKFATFYCQCYNSQSGYQRLALRGGTEQRTGRYEATEGLDILLAIVFLFSTALLLASRLVR